MHGTNVKIMYTHSKNCTIRLDVPPIVIFPRPGREQAHKYVCSHVPLNDWTPVI